MGFDEEDKELEMDKKITELVARVSDKKIVHKAKNLIKKPDLEQVPDLKSKVLQMKADGFTTAQIALAMGYDETRIAFLLEEKVELGSSEEVLQQSLVTLVSLIPIAEAAYREQPNNQNALALTGLIDSMKGVISEVSQLKDKEEIYRIILTKVLQPIIRGMVSDMMTEFRFLNKSMVDNPVKSGEHIEKAALAIGKKFEESYRKSQEILASIIGLNAEAKARVLATVAVSGG